MEFPVNFNGWFAGKAPRSKFQVQMPQVVGVFLLFVVVVVVVVVFVVVVVVVVVVVMWGGKGWRIS